MNDSPYIATIGLEVHAELRTKTKMFCNSRNDPMERAPNVNICPVCVADPGTLPVINREAVKHVLKVGIALGGRLADFTEFDRKNYFYPDIPKGYQISQYAYPLVSGGTLHGVAITRVHLEEDTARSQHTPEGDSVIDYNRAGLPLMELVTEPVIRSARQAADFARELQLLLRTLGASEANMEQGQMRVEANISVSKTQDFGTKVEVKNLNSFKVVEKAIAYEVRRQINVLEGGGTVEQETRGWDDAKQATFSQRKKENSDDYRYFPDPDLPKLKISEIPELARSVLEAQMPELPWEKRERLRKTYGIKEDDVETYVKDERLCMFFERAAASLGDAAPVRTASNYITSDILGALGKEESREPPEWLADAAAADRFAQLIRMVTEGALSSRAAKDILMEVVANGGDPEQIARKRGLMQESGEEELLPIVREIITEHEGVVRDYRGGKETALQFLIGQGMKKTRGAANPGVLARLLKQELGTS